MSGNRWNIDTLSAAELESTAVCPLNCRYCYIPKTDQMVEMHKKILSKIEDGTFIKNLKSIYGEKLTHLGFWGTEPVLSLNTIENQLPNLFKEFPHLKVFNFSTSLMVDVNVIVAFVKHLDKYADRDVDLEMQISIDGPDFITDYNRGTGAVETIVKNFVKFLDGVNKLELKKLSLKLKWKPTIDIDNMKVLMQGSNIRKYEDFFKNLNAIFNYHITNKMISINNNYVPSLAVPGKYTVEDGKTFTQFLKKLHEQGIKSTYTWRLDRTYTYRENLIKKRQYTCSGGNSNLGIEDYAHICHRSFFLNDEKYVDAILNSNSSIGEADNWDISLFQRGTIDFLKKNFIPKIDNHNEMTRFLYTMSGYHNFWDFQINYLAAITRELALSGQVDPEFLTDDDYLMLFSVFMITAHSCPMENLLNTGSVHLTPVSLMRMFGNGAFKEILLDYKRGIKQ